MIVGYRFCVSPDHQDTVPAVYEVDPRAVPLMEIVALTREIGSALQAIASITYTSIGARWYVLEAEMLDRLAEALPLSRPTCASLLLSDTE